MAGALTKRTAAERLRLLAREVRQPRGRERVSEHS